MFNLEEIKNNIIKITKRNQDINKDKDINSKTREILMYQQEILLILAKLVRELENVKS